MSDTSSVTLALDAFLTRVDTAPWADPVIADVLREHPLTIAEYRKFFKQVASVFGQDKYGVTTYRALESAENWKLLTDWASRADDFFVLLDDVREHVSYERVLLDDFCSWLPQLTWTPAAMTRLHTMAAATFVSMERFLPEHVHAMDVPTRVLFWNVLCETRAADLPCEDTLYAAGSAALTTDQHCIDYFKRASTSPNDYTNIRDSVVLSVAWDRAQHAVSAEEKIKYIHRLLSPAPWWLDYLQPQVRSVLIEALTRAQPEFMQWLADTLDFFEPGFLCSSTCADMLSTAPLRLEPALLDKLVMAHRSLGHASALNWLENAAYPLPWRVDYFMGVVHTLDKDATFARCLARWPSPLRELGALSVAFTCATETPSPDWQERFNIDGTTTVYQFLEQTKAGLTTIYQLALDLGLSLEEMLRFAYQGLAATATTAPAQTALPVTVI